MDFGGFTITPSSVPTSTGGNALDAANSNFQDNDTLEQLGLSVGLIQANNGKAGADNLTVALGKLMEPLAGHSKVAIAKAIQSWQGSVSKELRLATFKENQAKLFEALRWVLIQSDDEAIDYSNGNQMPAYYLALTIAKEGQDDPDFAELMLSDLETTIKVVLDGNMGLAEKVEGVMSSSGSGPNAASVRADSIRNLVRAFPLKVDSVKILKASVHTLLRLLNSAGDAPLLRMEASQKMQAMSVEQEHSQSRINSLWGDEVPGLLSAIKGGSTEMKRVLKMNKQVYSARSKKVEDYLSDMVDSLGLDDLGDLLQDIADYDPNKLVKSIPTFVRELANTAMKHKFLIMGLFLAIALVVGAGPLLPVLGSIAGTCGLSPQLFIPFFKLLTVIASSGEEQAVQSLFLVARIAKSGLCTAAENQSAVLDAVNIIKDKFKYSNVFQPETLKVLEEFAPSNAAAFKNIVTWNAGKAAKKGDNKDFLVNAGKVHPANEKTGVISRFLSPSKSAKKGTPSTAAAGGGGGSVVPTTSAATKMGAISPSPHSQNLMLLNQSDLAAASTPGIGMGGIDVLLSATPSAATATTAPPDSPIPPVAGNNALAAGSLGGINGGAEMTSPPTGSAGGVDTASKVLFPPGSGTGAGEGGLGSGVTTSNSSDAAADYGGATTVGNTAPSSSFADFVARQNDTTSNGGGGDASAVRAAEPSAAGGAGGAGGFSASAVMESPTLAIMREQEAAKAAAETKQSGGGGGRRGKRGSVLQAVGHFFHRSHHKSNAVADDSTAPSTSGLNGRVVNVAPAPGTGPGASTATVDSTLNNNNMNNIPFSSSSNNNSSSSENGSGTAVSKREQEMASELDMLRAQIAQLEGRLS
mmetsp:Transcript_22187/g.37409  ORF Transcript_22187/g.37409 Transcript_22187/m.37409 type:complete len:866 (+) Transcript_22187:218-2815(+)